MLSLPLRIRYFRHYRERSHKLKNGTKGYGYSFCQAMHINGNTTSFTVLNLGADFVVPKEDWDPLSDHIENHLRKDSVDLSGFSEVTPESFHKISKELAMKDYQIDQVPDKRELEVLASTELQNLRSIDGERLAIQVLEVLGFLSCF